MIISKLTRTSRSIGTKIKLDHDVLVCITLADIRLTTD